VVRCGGEDEKELNGLKHPQIEEYEINTCTMFIEPVIYGGKVYSRAVELEDEFLSPFKPLDIIKRGCDYFGVDYESRKRGTRQLIGYSRKIPIVIEPTNHIYFFPTASPLVPECIWISLEHVECYRRVSSKKTMITFRNKQSHTLPVSVSTIEGQILRCSLLKTKLLQRVEGNVKKLIYLPNGLQKLNALEKSRKYGVDTHSNNPK
jgi:competence protein ComK